MESRSAGAALRTALFGCLALVLGGSSIEAQTEVAIVVPDGSVSLGAPKRMAFPKPSLELIVRSSTRARDSRFPVACVSLTVETSRPRRIENQGSVEFVLEVLRAGDTVQRFDLAALPRTSGSDAVRASSCAGLAVLDAPRLDLEVGDVLRLEASLRGIRKLKRGEVVSVALHAAGRAVPDAAARRGDGWMPPRSARGEGLGLVEARAGVDVPGSLTGPISRGPKSAGVGLLLPAALPAGRLCLSVVTFVGLIPAGGLEHPPTIVVSKISVRRADGSSEKLRLRTEVLNREPFRLVCEERVRAYEAGDEILVDLRLNELVGELPSISNASIDVWLMAVEPE